MKNITILLSLVLLVSFVACKKNEVDNKNLTKQTKKNCPTNINADRNLLEAARTGNIELAQKAINNCANIDIRDHQDNNKTVSEIQMSSYSFEEMPDGNVMFKYEGEELFRQWTPLLWAVYKENKDIVKLLLENGADIESTDLKNGNTPLFLSANNLEITKLLIDKGANVNAKNKEGFSPLAFAVEANNIEVVKLLLKKGSDVNDTNSWDETPLMMASGIGAKDIAKILIDKGADVNMKSDIGVTALLLATNGKHFEIVKLLLKNGADVNATNKTGYTALKIVREDNNTEMVELLKSYGAKE